MIPYEELVAALDRYVARNGGTPMSARAPASGAMPSFAPPPSAHDEHAHDEHAVSESAFPSYDEHHDPDMPPSEDATHVGASPGGGSALPPPLEPVHEDQSNEIDIGDVLADEDLS